MHDGRVAGRILFMIAFFFFEKCWNIFHNPGITPIFFSFIFIFLQSKISLYSIFSLGKYAKRRDQSLKFWKQYFCFGKFYSNWKWTNWKFRQSFSRLSVSFSSRLIFKSLKVIKSCLLWPIGYMWKGCVSFILEISTNYSLQLHQLEIADVNIINLFL